MIAQCFGGPLDGTFIEVDDNSPPAFPWPRGWYYLAGPRWPWRYEWHDAPSTFTPADETLANRVRFAERAE